jgi:hypothetical protein
VETDVGRGYTSRVAALQGANPADCPPPRGLVLASTRG